MESAYNETPFFDTLVGLCDDLAWGRQADPTALYSLTTPGTGPEALVRLAEAFGLMLMKVEGRDFKNTQLVQELRQRNEELEHARAVLAQRNVVLQNKVRQTLHAQNVVAQCPAMRRVLDLVLSIARRPTNTLILGPTGSGKEVIAKIIHNNSPLSDGPFVAVNCTAIPETLFESEMFGIEKGVATGVSARKGLVEEAHGGTLFLDELAEMTLPNQAKLLRVLEERVVQRVGSAKTVPVDIKVIAATHVPLLQAVKEGRFREDLYYRINVVEVHLPPLRERGDDVLLLAQSFLDRHCARMGRERMSLTLRAKEVLQRYDWPGNVRELNNEMERAAALTAELCVDVADLSPRFQHIPDNGNNEENSGSRPSALPPLPTAAPPSPSLLADEERFNLEAVERTVILRALEHTSGNRSRAATLLGLTREGLRKKLLRMQL